MTRILTLALLLALTATAEEPQPQVKIDLRKADDRAQIISTATSLVVRITSTSGIGEATLTRVRGAWAPNVTIHLGIRGAESFGMENGIIRFSTSLMKSGSRRVSYWKASRSMQDFDPPDGELDLVATQKTESVEIIVPKEMLDGNTREIKFGWIDRFRV